MMQRGGATEQVRGRVEQANDKGLKVDGRWYNWSQFSRSSVRPNEGDDVELDVARGKFIDDARITAKGGQGALGFDDDDGPLARPDPISPRTAAAPRAPRDAAAPPTRPAPSSAPNADRNTEIRRLALIKAAADYAAARDMDPEEVVTLAS
ncbi:MAG TPA: hypothetical protein VFN74_12690, partial [Chloroflexota bacterium]|nr:hypothetical protein [Chloroflexota bacterium]